MSDGPVSNVPGSNVPGSNVPGSNVPGSDVPGSDGPAVGAGDRPAAASSDPGRGENPLARADRNMIEMLQELRVAQTGVQILFAFLLSLSFTDRFGRIDDVQRWTYVVTLLMTTLTLGLFVAPAAVHRLLFGRRVKAAVVRVGQRLFVAGLVTLALTLTGAVLLVLDVAIGRSLAIPVTGGVGVVLVGLWFVLPVPVLRRAQREEPDDEIAPTAHGRPR